VSIIRYRGVDETIESRDYFFELGQRFLTGVEQQIKARELTAKFAKDWGVVMMCHGFIASHILDDSDGLDRVRAGQSGNRDAQRKWLAHLIIREMDSGKNRADAEVAVAEKIKAVLRSRSFPSDFGQAWFSSNDHPWGTCINL
jgi:hypothetical protein